MLPEILKRPLDYLKWLKAKSQKKSLKNYKLKKSSIIWIEECGELTADQQKRLNKLKNLKGKIKIQYK